MGEDIIKETGVVMGVREVVLIGWFFFSLVSDHAGVQRFDFVSQAKCIEQAL